MIKIQNKARHNSEGKCNRQLIKTPCLLCNCSFERFLCDRLLRQMYEVFELLLQMHLLKSGSEKVRAIVFLKFNVQPK